MNRVFETTGQAILVYREASDMAYKEVSSIAEQLLNLHNDLKRAGQGDAADAVFDIFASADIVAGEISLLIHEVS